jgi:ATP-binding cassette, subfamily B, bacterial IrtA/YbtP
MPSAEPTRTASLRHLLRPIRGRLAVAVTMQACSSALVLAPLIGVGELAAVLLAPPIDSGRAWTIVTVSTVLLGIGFALRGLADLITHLADNTFALHLRRTLAARLTRAPLGWFGERTSGRIKQGLQDDVAALHHLVGHSFTDLTAALVTPVVVYAYLSTVDWRLTLVLLAPIPAYALVYRRMMAGSDANMSRYGHALGEVNDAVAEFIAGMPVVKSFGTDRRAHRAYRDAVDRFSSFFLGWVRPIIPKESLAGAILSPVTMVALSLGAGTAMVLAGALPPADLLPFVLLGIGVATPITRLSLGATQLQLAEGAAARVTALLDVPRAPEPESPVPPRGINIELDRVRFSYDGVHDVLHDVTATLAPGTITALVGASGSGKTTLARLLLRFHPVTGGEIRLGGVGLNRIASRDLSRIIGYVFQDVTLLRMSIADNIALGRLDATRRDIEAAARAANIHDRVLELPRGYDSVHGEDAALSGGEAQRVGIARALLLDPAVLVLDEPTSAADAETERDVQDALSALATSNPRRSVIVIAHRLDTITDVDQILVLANGRLVEQGDHHTLRAAGGTYSALWEAQHAASPALPNRGTR